MIPISLAMISFFNYFLSEMNTALSILFLAVGLVLLWKAAEFLVAGAVGLAERLGISPLVIGLTIVAMGTSAPEVAASIAAVFQTSGGGDIALGNVYGSNIANLALVGGICALIRPMRIPLSMLKREMPVMLMTGLLLLPMIYDLHLARPQAALLIAVFVALIAATVHIVRRQNSTTRISFAVDAEHEVSHIAPPKSIPKIIILIIAGLAGLAGGAKMCVSGAVFLGRMAGLSEAVIGLTIVAVGTSLPELVTSVVASIKKQDDISVGNLVGSNIFNTLLVTGIAGLIRPFDISPRFAGVEFWIMMAVSAGFIGLAVIYRRIIGRLGGTALLASYTAYIAYLFISKQ